MLREDKYASPPKTATTRSGKVDKTEAPIRLSKSTNRAPTTDIDGKVESVTDLLERPSGSAVSQTSRKSSSTFRDEVRSGNVEMGVLG